MGRSQWLLGVALLSVPAAGLAQQGDPVPAPDGSGPQDIVITGQRLPGSVIGDLAPVAVLDAEALRALGATRIDDILRLLKPLTTSASGSDPVFLLNGRRISGYQEIQTLPPEAIERSEILSEQDAARFGFPATVRVVNFITKKHFRAITAEQAAGTTTEGGGAIAGLDLGSTRLDGPTRQSVTIGYNRQDALNGARRPTRPDTSGLFDLTGNIAGIGGGSIDPALDALAGRSVTVAPLPLDPATRGTLAAYAMGGGAARITNLAPFQSIPGRDTLKVDGTQAVPIGRSVTASLNLTMEAQRSSGLAGLPTAVLRVPAGNPASPFTRDVLLYRYLGEAGVLRQRTNSLALHAGTTVQGTLARWQWTATGSYDRARVAATVDQGVGVAALQAAIDAGGDPFAPAGAGQLSDRLVSRSRTVTETLLGKATANGPLARLPAGNAQLTLAADYARSTSAGALGIATAPLAFGRTITGASATIDLPIAAPDRNVLAAIGGLTANATLGVSSVSGYGDLVNSAATLTWSPLRPVQVTASISTTRTPPAIGQLTNPVVTVPNAPFFDFVTGLSGLVTVTAGGNRGLAPERLQIRTVGVSWKPIKAKELRLNLDYIERQIEDKTINLESVTPAAQAAFPDRFVRDAAGRLTAVDLRPVMVSREVQRQIQGKLSLWMQLGAEPPPPAKDAPPPKPRPMIYGFATGWIGLEDRLMLRPGQPTLDLLDGGSLTGGGGRPRYEAQGNLGGSYGPVQGGFYATWQAPTRVRSDIAAADLRFSAKAFVGLYATIDAARLAPRAPLARKMTFQLNVQNLFNQRQTVRDRTGTTPYRFQPVFLDPYGRIVRLAVRKVF